MSSNGRERNERKGVLPRQTLRVLIDQGHISSSVEIPDRNIQPASIDLTLGDVAYRLRCSFLPGTDFLARHIRTFEDYRAELDATSDILRSVDDTAFRDIALGQNYFDMLHLPYAAPAVCSPKTT